MNPEPYYRGLPEKQPDKPVSFRTDLRERLDSPDGYLPDNGLVKAVNAAMILGQPLLLTGEPGVGKSRAANAIAYALNLGTVGEVLAKSDTTASDLYYTFDHMRRLFDYQSGEVRPVADYLTFNALGRAILLAGGADAMTTPIPGSGKAPMRHHDLLRDENFSSEPRQSVVLIDEIDKAPRDVPNDVLNEIDRMFFDVPELGQRISAPTSHKPLVVMTSNSEKNLPEPFLRRCVFHNIPFPVEDPKDNSPSLQEIVAQRIGALRGGGRLVDEAIELFVMMRDARNGFEHKPSPSELLNWLLLLTSHEGLGATSSLKANPDIARARLSVLLKNRNDQELGRSLVERWLKPR